MTLLIGSISFIVIFRYLVSKNEKLKYKWHKQILKFPVFGEMILKSLLARISLILGNRRFMSLRISSFLIIPFVL